ncbi:MAG: peptidase U32 family protein [Desulfobacterales bacterium]|nr:peptidase U32 family protein [Desulfobacterales bacterium]
MEKSVIKEIKATPCPSILAPAGNKASFLAALAAGADAVYCGLKSFSARMEAKNFTVSELIPLTQLAHDKNIKVFVALNSLLKHGDLNVAGKLLDKLNRYVKPDAIIIQDLALVQLAVQTGFAGELHLSTLANASFQTALKLIRKDLGVDKVVVPRELNIDEIKQMASACPKGLGLEVFIHGALCYGVSGRCYWSSFLGGKSGLRGRCVQPCRRLYTQNGQTKRFFSCMDLSLDVLTKVLLSIPEIQTWKIEGRKKGPHYVFHTVKAYKLLRDHRQEPGMKKAALDLLANALGRTGTHYYFLSQRPQNPVNIDTQTGSGLLVGKIQGAKQKPYIIPRQSLMPGDLLRFGYEDDSWHSIYSVPKYIPKRGRIYIKLSSAGKPGQDIPVFLTDRREKWLQEILSGLEDMLTKIPETDVASSNFNVRLPGKHIGKKRDKSFELNVNRESGTGIQKTATGVWIFPESEYKPSKKLVPNLWWWLPPVIWPEDEEKIKSLIEAVIKNGGRNFVLNSPWQIALFTNPKFFNLWAGPFCNIANALAINTLLKFGFSGAIVSPELDGKDFLNLPENSPLPLGIVITGNWPLSISRIISSKFETDTDFISPKGEHGWVKKYGSDFWVYPNWKLDISSKKDELKKAGYLLFVKLIEPVPAEVKMKKRPGLWNWDLKLN